MPACKPIALIEMGLPPESVHAAQGGPSNWFPAALGLAPEALLIIRPDLGMALPDPQDFALAIISGSWSMVTDKADWSERTAVWARSLILSGAPLLGVCYGHQIMAHAMGGAVDDHPEGREQGTYAITLTETGRHDPLLRPLPSPFMAHLSHAQSVLSLPPGAQVLAGSAHDPHQILRYGPNAVSVQFHPEFTVDILACIMTDRATRDARAAPALRARAASLPETPQARGILRRFVATHAPHCAPACCEPGIGA